MKIFLDANVLFAAAYSPSGKSAALLETVASMIITSDYAVEEARRNIQIKKPEAMARLEKFLSSIKIVNSRTSHVCPIDVPEKDRPIFVTALAERTTHLLTGDLKDFGAFMNDPVETEGILIQTVHDFLKSLANEK